MHQSSGMSKSPDANSRLQAKSDDEQGAVIHHYQQRVGKLIYAMLGTRPDTSYQHWDDLMPIRH